MTQHAALRRQASRFARPQDYTRLDLFLEADRDGAQTIALLSHLDRIATESGRLSATGGTAEERSQARELNAAVQAAIRIVRLAWAQRQGRELGRAVSRSTAGVLA